MGKFTEFAEVLEGKIRQEWMEEQRSAEFQAKVQDVEDTSPSCLAQLLGSQPVYRRAATGTKAYAKFHKPRPPHKLNAIQFMATEFFKKHGMQLTPAFSQKELKRAYRALAIKLHPDTGAASADSFILLKNAYDLLSAV